MSYITTCNFKTAFVGQLLDNLFHMGILGILGVHSVKESRLVRALSPPTIESTDGFQFFSTRVKACGKSVR